MHKVLAGMFLLAIASLVMLSWQLLCGFFLSILFVGALYILDK